MQFLSRGVITSAIAVIISFLGISGKAGEFLTDPSTVDNFLIIVGAIGALIGGAMKGVDYNKNQQQPVQLPGATQPEYPGWLWDPAKGWVPDPNYKPEVQ